MIDSNQSQQIQCNRDNTNNNQQRIVKKHRFYVIMPSDDNINENDIEATK